MSDGIATPRDYMSKCLILRDALARLLRSDPSIATMPDEAIIRRVGDELRFNMTGQQRRWALKRARQDIRVKPMEAKK